MTGIWWAVLSGLGFGLFQTFNRRAGRGMDAYRATFILLLVSASFINSRYCRKELQTALTLRDRKRSLAVPIILRPCDWESTAHCAGDQGKYWEMRDTLFKNNSKLGPEQLPGYAREIGLDVDVFNRCLSSKRHQAQIDQSSQKASQIGITGTPSFIIGKSDGDTVSGRLIIGAQPPTVFTTAIQQLLDQGNAQEKTAEKKPGS